MISFLSVSAQLLVFPVSIIVMQTDVICLQQHVVLASLYHIKMSTSQSPHQLGISTSCMANDKAFHSAVQKPLMCMIKDIQSYITINHAKLYIIFFVQILRTFCRTRVVSVSIYYFDVFLDHINYILQKKSLNILIELMLMYTRCWKYSS